MSDTSFEIMQREPMCEYCREMPASWWVTTQVHGQERRYGACQLCKEAVQNGLHECDYTCEEDHYGLIQRSADPQHEDWLRERLSAEVDRHREWMRSGCPPLREENGIIVWDKPTPLCPDEG